MKIESNIATRFLALSAVAFTLAAPSRADWTTVRPDGSIVTVPSSPSAAAPPRSASPSASGNAAPDDYSSDTGDSDADIPALSPRAANSGATYVTYDGQNRARSPRVQANRDRNRQRNNDRRNGGAGRLNPTGGLGYGAAPYYNGYSNGYAGYGYNAPSYPYGVPNYGGYGYGGYGGTVVAPGGTIILPQVPTTTQIGPTPFPWVIPPTITTIPNGGTTVINNGYGNPAYGGAYNGYPGAIGQPFPPAVPPSVTYSYTYPYGNSYGSPYGYPGAYGYGAYPNGTVTQSYGGISISRGGISASAGGVTTSTSSQTTWGYGRRR